MNKIISYKSHNKEKYNDKVLSETETPDGLNKKITNEKIKNEKKSYLDLLSNAKSPKGIFKIYDDYEAQLLLIEKLYKGIMFEEEKYFTQALKTKMDSYKQQDKKKTYDDYNDFITLNNIIEKLVQSSMLCYYCNNKTLILFKNSRDEYQWTLDRINNYDEHSNKNTIICCLKCNIQRRRTNSEKFKFTKQLEHKLIILKKLS
jgi:hypothetical protein